VKGCLIAAAVVFAGCMGLTFLGFLFGAGSQHQQEEESGFNTPLTPPAGQVAYAAVAPSPQPDKGDDDPEAPPVFAPGCYVSEARFESAADEDGRPGESWEFVELVSRSQVACPNGRQKALNAQAQELAESWPFPEEVLQLEDSSPAQEAEEEGLFRKVVRAHTRVANTAH
jgi:hypothetical protein